MPFLSHSYLTVQDVGAASTVPSLLLCALPHIVHSSTFEAENDFPFCSLRVRIDERGGRREARIGGRQKEGCWEFPVHIKHTCEKSVGQSITPFDIWAIRWCCIYLQSWLGKESLFPPFDVTDFRIYCTLAPGVTPAVSITLQISITLLLHFWKKSSQRS